MKIVCIGGGPAGLYFSLLMKKHNPSHEIVVVDHHCVMPQTKARGGGVGPRCRHRGAEPVRLRRAEEIHQRRVREMAAQARLRLLAPHDARGDDGDEADGLLGLQRTKAVDHLAERQAETPLRCERALANSRLWSCHGRMQAFEGLLS